MATLNIGGQRVNVDDAFLSLPPEQQQATVDEIAQSLGGQTPQSGPMITVGDRQMSVAEYQAMPDAQRQALRDQISDANPDAPGMVRSSVLDPLVQGTTFGWGDELRGLIQGGKAAMQGGDFGQTYDQTVDESRQSLERERRVNPVGSFVAELGGAIPTSIIGGGAALAGKGATLGARALAGALVGGGQGAVYGAGQADGDLTDRAIGAGVGGAFGGTLGAVAPWVGNRIAQFMRSRAQGALLDQSARQALRSGEIKAAASQMFESATGNAPPVLNDTAYFRFLGDMTNKARSMRINDRLSNEAVGLVQMMMEMGDDVSHGNVGIDLGDLHILRQVAQGIAEGPEGARQSGHFARHVVNQLDDFINHLRPGDIAGGTDPRQAANTLIQGISTWARANRVALVEEAIRRGQNAASGPEKGVRNALRALMNNQSRWRLFNEAERQAIADVVHGTAGSNIAKLIGTFGFGGNTATNGIGGAAGMMLGNMAAGPMGMIVGPVVGAGAKVMSERATNRLANRALGAVADPMLRSLPPIDPSRIPAIETALRRLSGPLAGQIAPNR